MFLIFESLIRQLALFMFKCAGEHSKTAIPSTAAMAGRLVYGRKFCQHSVKPSADRVFDREYPVEPGSGTPQVNGSGNSSRLRSGPEGTEIESRSAPTVKLCIAQFRQLRTMQA